MNNIWLNDRYRRYLEEIVTYNICTDCEVCFKDSIEQGKKIFPQYSNDILEDAKIVRKYLEDRFRT